MEGRESKEESLGFNMILLKPQAGEALGNTGYVYFSCYYYPWNQKNMENEELAKYF